MIKNRILIIDNLCVIDWERTLLERAGLEIVTARNYEEAEEIFAREKPDLVLAELGPEGSAVDRLCRRIRNEAGDGATSLLLLYSLPGDLQRADSYAPNATLQKPFKPEALLEKVGELLAIKSRGGYRVLVSVEVKAATGSETFLCSSQNISVTGMLIETGKILQTRDQVACAFSLPGTRRVAANGEVVRVATPAAPGMHYYGIRFITLDAEAQANIESFVGESIIFS